MGVRVSAAASESSSRRVGLRWVLACLLLLGLAGAAPALETQFRSVAVPQRLVPAIAQDGDGFIWLATGQGLMRYDGYRLRPLEAPGERVAERNLGWIRALIASRDGGLWIGSESQGLLRQRPGAAQAERHGGKGWAIRAIAEAGDGGLWVGSLGQGLQRYLPAEQRFEPQELAWRGQPERRVLALRLLRDGSAWAGHWHGLARRAADGRWQSVELPDAPEGATVLALAEDEAGRLWFGTQDGGIGVVERDGRPRWLRRNLGRAVQALVQGSEGWLWAGTKKGLLALDPLDGATLRELHHDPRLPGGLAGDDISSLLVDREGALWVAGYGLGLQRLQRHPAFAVRGADAEGLLNAADIRALLPLPARDELLVTTQTGHVMRLDARPGAGLATLGRWPRGGPAGIVEALAAGRDGEIWLAQAGRLQRHAADGRLLASWVLPGGRAQRLLWRANGELWAAMQDGVYRLAGTQALRPERLPLDGQALIGPIHALIEDGDETLWLGGQAGLLRWEQGGLRRVEGAPGEPLGTPIVIGLLRGRDGRLWVDTPVSGLHRLRSFDAQGRARFERISERHGVEGRFGGNLQEDAQGRIWSQLLVYDPAADRIDGFGPAEGADFGTFWFFASAALADGRLLFGGSRGLLVVNPAAYRPQASAPALRIAALQIDGEARALPSEGPLSLPAGTQSLALEFAALDYADPGALRYRYRLIGLDERWTEVDAGSRTLRLNRLAPGRYQLQLQASRHATLWGDEQLQLEIAQRPAWWQTAWARAGAAAAALLLFWALLQWRTRQLRQRELALQALVEQRTAELREASLTDALTGLRNRRYLQTRLDEDLRRCLRRHRPPAAPGPDADLLLMLLDIDHFKRINDEHGHAAGDAVLVQFAQRLRGLFRDTDSLIRWGGEEVLALVRDSNRERAPELAERVLAAMRDEPFRLDDGREVRVSVSIGFAAFPLDPALPRAWDWQACLDLADAGLYAAKAAGRDRYRGALRANGVRPEMLVRMAEAWLREPRIEWSEGGR